MVHLDLEEPKTVRLDLAEPKVRLDLDATVGPQREFVPTDQPLGVPGTRPPNNKNLTAIQRAEQIKRQADETIFQANYPQVDQQKIGQDFFDQDNQNRLTEYQALVQKNPQAQYVPPPPVSVDPDGTIWREIQTILSDEGLATGERSLQGLTDSFGLGSYLQRKGLHPTQRALEATGLAPEGLGEAHQKAIDWIGAAVRQNKGALSKENILPILSSVPRIAAEFAVTSGILKGGQAGATTVPGRIGEGAMTFAAHTGLQAPQEGETVGDRLKSVATSGATGAAVGGAGELIGKLVTNPVAATATRATALPAGFAGAAYLEAPGTHEDKLDAALEAAVTVLGFELLGIGSRAKEYARIKFEQLTAGKELTGPVVREGVDRVEAELRSDIEAARASFRETGKVPDELVQKYAIGRTEKGEKPIVTPEQEVSRETQAQAVPEMAPEPAGEAGTEKGIVPAADVAAAEKPVQPPQLPEQKGLATEDQKTIQSENVPVADVAVVRQPEEVTDLQAQDEPPETFSARQAQIDADREAWGKPGLQSPERRSWGKAVGQAKRRKLPEKATETAAALLAKPRPIDDIETAGLVLRRAQIQSEHDQLVTNIENIKEPADIAFEGAKLQRLEEEFDLLTEAIRVSGSEKGRALAAQKLTINRDLKLVSVLNRAKVKKGKDLTPTEREKFEKLTQKHEVQEKRIGELEKQVEELTARRALRVGSNRRYRGMSEKARDVDLRTRVSRVGELLKSGCA